MVDNTSRAVTLYRYTSFLLVCSVLSADKTLLISMRCFSRMLISNVHKSAIIVMNSIDQFFSRNVFEAVQKSRSTCFIGSKTTRLCLMVLNPIKHSCSFFKHYIKLSTRIIIIGLMFQGRLVSPLSCCFIDSKVFTPCCSSLRSAHLFES